MLWTEFAKQEPELARHGARLLAEDHGYVFLATIAADGSPRIHPIAPILSASGLFVAIIRTSPKLADLRREPRIALHATVVPPDDEEFSVRGVAVAVEGEAAREAAVAGAHGGARLSDAMALFAVEPTAVGWARWTDGEPVRRRWRAPHIDA
jgi:pyridoxamine 5'-phosphate oxidase-like protein